MDVNIKGEISIPKCSPFYWTLIYTKQTYSINTGNILMGSRTILFLIR